MGESGNHHKACAANAGLSECKVNRDIPVYAWTGGVNP